MPDIQLIGIQIAQISEISEGKTTLQKQSYSDFTPFSYFKWGVSIELARHCVHHITHHAACVIVHVHPEVATMLWQQGALYVYIWG